jgi:predicted nucleotide-binding protein
MTLADARQRLKDAGYRIRKEARLDNRTGTQLRLDRGATVNVFDNGNYSCEGKHCEVAEAILDRVLPAEKPEPSNQG